MFTVDSLSSEIVCGVGDDAAVIRSGASDVLLFTVDQQIEGVHFDSTFPPEIIGQKALFASISDIAAMGGRPLFFLLAVAFPPSIDDNFISRLRSGIHQAANEFRVELIGGNTTRSSTLLVSVTVIGDAKDDHIVYRSGAKPGEDLYVTGRLGQALLLLEDLRDGECARYNSGALSIPRPLPHMAQLLAQQSFVSSMIDLSDGLAQDLANLADASNVGFHVDATAIPLAEDERPDFLDLAVSSGEEYQLLFTTQRGKEEKLQALAKEQHILLSRIGETKPKTFGIQLQRKARLPAPSTPCGRLLRSYQYQSQLR